MGDTVTSISGLTLLPTCMLNRVAVVQVTKLGVH